jgi:hypothetical protein
MQGIENIRFSASQNSETFTFLAVTEQPTLARANTIASSFNGLIGAALLADKNGWKKLGEDERKLLSGAKATVAEKSVTINISLAAADFQEMTRRALSEKQEVANK